MRTQNLQNAIEIEYPDAIAFSGDRNTVVVRSLTGDEVGARLTFSDALSNSIVLEYQSENSILVFNIVDTIRALLNGQHQTMTVSGNVSNGGVSYNITPFAVTVERGRTLNDRPAGCVRTMYYMNDQDLEKMNIYVPVGGTITVNNNTYPLVAGVNSLNLTEDQYGTPITPPSGNFSGQVVLSYPHSTEPTVFGSLWHHNNEADTRYDISFVQVYGGYDCGGGSYSNYFKLKFLNCDGCWETFIGKLIKQKRTVTYGEYVSGGLVKNTPMATVNETKDEVIVALEDIPYDAYFTDIVFAQEIVFENGYGELKNCILGSNNITDEPKDGTSNFEITLKILA